MNLGYASAFDKWRANFTVQWFGQRPLAHISSTRIYNSGQEYTPESAPRYALLNTQLTRAFKRLDVHVGVENLTNYRQPNPINGAANPFRPDFDAAMVWDQYTDDLPVRIHATALSSMANGAASQ